MFFDKILESGGGGSLTPGTTPIVGTEHAILYIDSAILQGSANFTYDGSTVNLTDAYVRVTKTDDDYTYGNQLRYGLDVRDTVANLTEGYGAITRYGTNISITVGTTNMKRSQAVYGNKTTISCYDGVVDETVYAYGWFRTSSGNVSDGETVTVGTVTYTFRNTLSAEGDVKIGTSQFLSLSNLGAAINGTGTYGVDHQVSAANADATCTGVYSTTINLVANAIGVAGESVALAETSARLTRSASTLLRKSATSYSIVMGQDISIDVQEASASSILGIRSIVNFGTSASDQTCGLCRGIESQIAVNALDATIARGSVHGAYVGAYVNGGLVTDLYGLQIDMTLQNDGASSFSAVSSCVYGIKVTATGSCLAGTTAGDAIALYLPDFNFVQASRVFGIMQLGVCTNYFEGPMTFLALQTGGVVIATPSTGALSLVTDAAGVLTSDGSGNLSFSPVTPAAAGSDTQVQFNDGGAIGGDAELTFAKTTGVLTVGASTNAAAIILNGPGRAADGRSVQINNSGAAGVCALEINAHAGGTVGYGINISAIIPINIMTVGSNYAITSINHVNIAESGGASFTIGAGDQASAKHNLLLQRIGAGAHTGNSIAILRDNSTAGNGSVAGADNDVLGTISFKGYDDKATPQLTEFAQMYCDIRDASDTTEMGSIGFKFMHAGALKEMVKWNVYGASGYFTYFDFKTPAASGIGAVLRVYTEENSGAQIVCDGRGGDGQFWLSEQLVGKWGFGHSVVNKGFYMNSTQSGYYPFSIVVESATKENWVFGANSSKAIPADANKNIFFHNGATAPSAVPVDMTAVWSADRVAGDARLYLMGEKNTNTIAFGAGNIHFDPRNMADDSVSGKTFTGQAGENLVWGDVVYLKSDGKFWKADFNATTTTPAVAFCTGTIAADGYGEFLEDGWVRDDSAYNFTFGAQAGTVYLGESGAITQTAPSGSGDQVQVLGWALEADIFYFRPQLVMVEV